MISRTLQFVMAAGFTASCGMAAADIVTVDETPFVAAAATGVITFSEEGFSLGTINPAYTAANYGGVTGSGTPDVAFGAFFVGQTQDDSCKSACVIDPAGGLSAFAAGPGTILSIAEMQAKLVAQSTASVMIQSDDVFVSEPILAGSVEKTGAISMLFSHNVLGVGFDIGHIGLMARVRAFDETGAVIGTWDLVDTGFSFFGLRSTDTAHIRAIQITQTFDVGIDDAFGIDNVRFLAFDSPTEPPTPTPEPGSLLLVGLGLLAAGAARRRAG